MKRITIAGNHYDYNKLSELSDVLEKSGIVLEKCQVDDKVSIGFNSIITGCEIGYGVYIGNSCKINGGHILSGAKIKQSVVLDEAAIMNFAEIPSRSMITRTTIPTYFSSTRPLNISIPPVCIIGIYPYNANCYWNDKIPYIRLGCHDLSVKEWRKNFWNNGSYINISKLIPKTMGRIQAFITLLKALLMRIPDGVDAKILYEMSEMSSNLSWLELEMPTDIFEVTAKHENYGMQDINTEEKSLHDDKKRYINYDMKLIIDDYDKTAFITIADLSGNEIIAYRCKSGSSRSSNIAMLTRLDLKDEGHYGFGFAYSGGSNTQSTYQSKTWRGAIEKAMASRELFVFRSYDQLAQAVVNKVF